jgi:hypothetical protein
MRGPAYSFVILASLFLVISAINYGYLYLRKNDTTATTEIDMQDLMTNVMGTIFIVFGSLKLLNLQGFSTIFSKYDIVSKHVPGYATLYPFIEIFLGIVLLHKAYLREAYKATIALMVISLVGVSWSLQKGLNLRCGCLGSFFHVPLSYVTISENLVMAGMAGYLLKTTSA